MTVNKVHLCVHQCLLWLVTLNLLQVLCPQVNGKGSVLKLSPKAERVKLEQLLFSLCRTVLSRIEHVIVVYCITNARTVCMCSTDSVGHLFLVCAFVFA